LKGGQQQQLQGRPITNTLNNGCGEEEKKKKRKEEKKEEKKKGKIL